MLAGTGAAAKPLAGRNTSLTLGDGRIVPVRIWEPAGKARALIAFSHGANSRPDKYDRLLERLAAAGYRVVAPLHADSPDHPGGGTIAREAGIPMRLADMRAVLAQAGGLPTIAAGHSYGALIAQMLGGAGTTPPEPVKAVVAWSPPGPFPPALAASSWASLARPQLVITGTADILPMMAPTWDVHRVSFDVAPGPSALFVGAGVDHYFGNIIGRPERTETGQAPQFNEAVALTLAFLKRTLAGKSLASLAVAARAGQSWVEVKR
ncbi:MAG: alpha/beta fold hydrolase [Sandarakinorhabdus sp.]|nr:alpha/beta fold hydrolase [Sandarakinorhabdus sp.]